MMIKKIFILLLFSNLLTAQQPIGYIDYLYKHKVDTIINSRVARVEIRVIYDEQQTYSFDKNKLKQYENIAQQFKMKNPTMATEKVRPLEFTVYNFEKKNFDNYKSVNVWYKTSEPIEISWEITSEQKMFNTYLCQKAICNFKGRIYEAWFTTDIPLPIAPWKLKGLPGAVLYAVDKTGSVEFTATYLANDLAENVVEVPVNVESVSKEQMKVIEENYLNQISNGISATKNGEEYRPTNRKKKEPTNPIELTQ